MGWDVKRFKGIFTAAALLGVLVVALFLVSIWVSDTTSTAEKLSLSGFTILTIAVIGLGVWAIVLVDLGEK